jgi:hypothetical protein
VMCSKKQVARRVRMNDLFTLMQSDSYFGMRASGDGI